MKKWPTESPKPVSHYQAKQLRKSADTDTTLGRAMLNALKKVEKKTA
jgi:hypothetical protein